MDVSLTAYQLFLCNKKITTAYKMEANPIARKIFGKKLSPARYLLCALYALTGVTLILAWVRFVGMYEILYTFVGMYVMVNIYHMINLSVFKRNWDNPIYWIGLEGRK